jgi:hypothetical protein
MGFTLDGVDLLLKKHKTDIMSMKEKFKQYAFYVAMTTYIAFMGSIVVGAIYMLMQYGN